MDESLLALCPNSIVGDACRLSAVPQQSRSFWIGVASASHTRTIWLALQQYLFMAAGAALQNL
jgi:hypothetical protein